MKKQLVLLAFLLSASIYFAVPARPIAIVVPIGQAVASTAAGSTAINAAVNLIGIAVASFIFYTNTTSDTTFRIPAQTVPTGIPGTSITEYSTEPLDVLEGEICDRFTIRTYAPSPTGGQCAPVYGALSQQTCSSPPPATSYSTGSACSVPGGATVTVPSKLDYVIRPRTGTSARVTEDFSIFYKQPSGSATLDKNAEIQITEQGFAPPTDVDYSPSAGGASSTPAFTDDGSVYVQYADSSDRLTVAKFDPTPDGINITEYSQLDGGQVRQTNINTSPQGVIETVTQNYYSGEVQNIPQTSNGIVPNFTVVNNASQNPSPDGQTSPPPGGTVQFPSDYARLGEASAAAQLVVEAITQGELLTPEVEDTEMPWFGSTFDGVLPTINTSGSTCPVWQFDALGESFYIDHHCQLMVDFNPLFYAMFTAFWVLLAFRTVLEA
jgi:hypothetical protein